MATTPLPITIDFRGAKLEEQLAEIYALQLKIFDIISRTTVSDAFMQEMNALVADSTAKSDTAQALFDEVGRT